MKSLAWSLLMLALVHAPARADMRCAQHLSEGQLETLRAGTGLNASYEIFTRRSGLYTKVVALVGEPMHLYAINQFGEGLHGNFDAVAMSFRRKMDLQDRLFEWLAPPVAAVCYKIATYLDKDDRPAFERASQNLQRFLRNPRTMLTLDNKLKPFGARPELINNPFYEVHDDVVYNLDRGDLPQFLWDAQERGEKLRMINLEHGFKRQWQDEARSKIFSLNMALYGTVIALGYALPDSVVSSFATGVWGIGFFWQTAGLMLQPQGDKAWFTRFFPFVFVGDERRNVVAAPTISEAMKKPFIKSAVVIVEKRRVADLRERLISLGFESAGGEPARAPGGI